MKEDLVQGASEQASPANGHPGIPMKMYFMGHDIEELSREELIEAVRLLYRQIEATRAAARSLIEISAWRNIVKPG